MFVPVHLTLTEYLLFTEEQTEIYEKCSTPCHRIGSRSGSMSPGCDPAGLNIGVIKQVLGADPEQYAVIPERLVGCYIEHVIVFDEPFPDIAIRI